MPEPVFLWPSPECGGSATLAATIENDDADATQPSRVLRGIRRGSLTAVLAAQPTGAAALVIPGGGYTQLVFDKEGIEIARWLAGIGVHAFVLAHRLPGEVDAEGQLAPLRDARRAIRLIRAGATRYAIDPARIGVVGLSSGGHLAAALAAHPETDARDPAGDAIDRVDARADFLVAGYAPVSTNARDALLDPTRAPLEPPAKQALYDAFPVDRQASAAFPPAFLVTGDNDARVPAENFIRLYAALRGVGVATELHVFADAPHGFALRSDGPVAAWPALCENWLRQRGILGPARTG